MGAPKLSGLADGSRLRRMLELRVRLEDEVANPVLS